MSIEQHAEAAAKDIGETPDSTLGVVEHVIAKHRQSAIDEATAPLRARIAELEDSLIKQNHEVCQTLGKALRYPWFKHDQENFPGASHLDGVCAADHVPETLAAEAAKRIAKLEGLGPLIEEYGDARANFVSTYCPETYEECDMWSKKSLETRAKITAILKGGGA